PLAHEVISVGEIESAVKPALDPLLLADKQEVGVPFQTPNVYKGNFQPGAFVQIRLPSDMLVFPGETVSRFEMRKQLAERNRAELMRVSADRSSLPERARGGEMTAADVARRQRELDALSADLIAQSERLRRMPQGGGPFYD